MEKSNHEGSDTPYENGKEDLNHVEANQEVAYYVPKTTRRNVLYILMIGTGMIAGGSANAVIATTLAQPTFVRHMDLDGPNALSLMGGTNGTFYAGGFFGVFFAAWASDRFGRRKALWITGILNIISCVLCAASVNIAMFIAVRYVDIIYFGRPLLTQHKSFIAGFAASQFVMQTPTFQSEIAPPHLRGLLVGTMGMFNVLGYNVANWCGVGFYHIPESEVAWRMIFVIVGGLTILNMVLIYFVPESPRWLVMKGRLREAEDVLRLIHSTPTGIDETILRIETMQIERQVTAEKDLSVSYWEMLANPRWRRRTLLCAGIGCLGQVRLLFTVREMMRD